MRGRVTPSPAERGRVGTGVPDPLADVSRETLGRLETFVALLTRWNKRINLVAPATLPDVWQRHIVDSAQIFPLLPLETRILVDLGSGGGFPGLALAILGVPEVHLVESDRRKVEFLREAARVAGTPVHLHATRIEALPTLPADVVTARALKPLDETLTLAASFHRPATACYFHKGASWADEVAAARRSWRFQAVAHPSATDQSGVVLELREIERAD